MCSCALALQAQIFVSVCELSPCHACHARQSNILCQRMLPAASGPVTFESKPRRYEDTRDSQFYTQRLSL
jgi:hypothetical protein